MRKEVYEAYEDIAQKKSKAVDGYKRHAFVDTWFSPEWETFVTYCSLMHPYVDTMCLGILGTIGSLRPDSSLGLCSVYDVSALAYTSPSSIQL